VVTFLFVYAGTCVEEILIGIEETDTRVEGIDIDVEDENYQRTFYFQTAFVQAT